MSAPPDDFDDDHVGYEEEVEYDPGEDCGRWNNGKLGPYYWCRSAGTEFCDFECPYSRPPARTKKPSTPA